MLHSGPVFRSTETTTFYVVKISILLLKFAYPVTELFAIPAGFSLIYN